jgi:C-terminal processing protease CtpA/Prc
VSLPKDVESDLAQRVLLLPLQVKVIGGKPYVFRDFSSSSSSLAGLEISSIDGVPAAHIVKTLVSVTPGDGDTVTSREARISDWSFATELVRMFGSKNHYRVTLRDATRKRETRVDLAGVELPKLLEASRQRYRQDQWIERSADLAMLDNGATARMTVRGFGGFADADRKLDLRQFFKESFETMRVRGTKALILDVRNNGGGEDELGQILLSYLVDAPFTYYEDLVLNKTSFEFAKYAVEKVEIPENLVERRADGRYHAVGHPNWGKQQPREPVFTGNVIALINGGSFSTTSEFLSQLHNHHRAIFVGEESGGGYYGNTSGPDAQVVLPNSKLVVQIPLLTYYMAVRGFRGAESHGIVPDYSAIPSVADLIAGRDPAMDKALELARAPRFAGK